MSTISDAEFVAYFYHDKTKDKARKIMKKMGIKSKEYMEVIDNMNVIQRPTLNKTLIYTTLVFALVHKIFLMIFPPFAIIVLNLPTFILICISIDHVRKHKNKLKNRYLEDIELDLDKKQLQEKIEKKWKEIKTKKKKSS